MRNNHNKTFMQMSKNSGMVLVVCLIFTLMVTLLGVINITTATISERAAGNHRDQVLAFQAAEATLRNAEGFLATSGASATFNDSNGLYDSTDGVNMSWADALSKKNYDGPTLAHVSETPTYIIELLPDNLISNGSIVSGKPVVSSDPMYRITTRAEGSSTNSVVMLQSIYCRRQ